MPNTMHIRGRRVALGVQVLLFCLVITLPADDASAYAPLQNQAEGWKKSETEHFIIHYRGAENVAVAHFKSRADAIYKALSAAFETDLEQPLQLRLYADDEEYLRGNPILIEVEGVIALSRRSKREVDISLSRALALSLDLGDDAGKALSSKNLVLDAPAELGLDNALRRELAYLMMSQLSDGQMAAGFATGIALYMEAPSDPRRMGIPRLRAAYQADNLLPWSALNSPGAEFIDPPLTQPQNLAIVHFLVSRYGYSKLLDFIAFSGRSSGWRNALESAYGAAPARLAADWEASLQGFLDGGWREHALYGKDLSSAKRLISQGDYKSARSQLQSALALVEGMDEAAAREIRGLLERAEAGQDAQSAASAAASALAAGNYAEAETLALDAESGLDAVDDRAGLGLAREVAARARMGLDAEAALQRSRKLPPWRIAEARMEAYEAMRLFSLVGNDLAADEAAEEVRGLDRRQAPFGLVLALLGIGILWRNKHLRQSDLTRLGLA